MSYAGRPLLISPMHFCLVRLITSIVMFALVLFERSVVLAQLASMLDRIITASFHLNYFLLRPHLMSGMMFHRYELVRVFLVSASACTRLVRLTFKLN
jgi:hypothetical protein